MNKLGYAGLDPAPYYGRTITRAFANERQIKLTLDNEVTICLTDAGQSCCEYRYMTIEDNIEDLVGKKLTEISVREGGTREAEYDVHDIYFLHIKAEDECLVVANHNEHNGYYGGFDLTLTEEKA